MSAANSDKEIFGLHPLTTLPPDTQPSEQRVHEALSASLPTGWSAWHSLKVRTKTTQFSEADFVIADPERGILVLEVKGGIIRKEDGVWLQNGRPMKAQPLDQAHRFVRCLLAKYGEFGHVAPPIGVAVCFPDTPFETPPAQGDLQGIVLGARELPFLQELLPGFLERTFQTVRARTPSPGWGKFLHDLWCECWPAAMSLSCAVRDRAARRVRLDGDQFETLACVLDNDVVLVRGGAGTGKTLLARELALREAGAGRSVLLLTYTEALGFELAAELEGRGIAVRPVARFALDRLRRRGFDEEERREPEFWDRVTRRAAGSRRLWRDCVFDTVIVDEGQDFGRDEWKIAMRCAGKARRVWVFADPGQAFWSGRKIPAAIGRGAVKFTLGRPYRCPPAIQALADGYAGKTCDYGAVAAGVGDGTVKIVVCGDGEALVREAVEGELRGLLFQNATCGGCYE